MLDSTQLVSGVAVLLSFLADYRYGMRNLTDQVQTTEKNLAEKVFRSRIFRLIKKFK